MHPLLFMCRFAFMGAESRSFRGQTFGTNVVLRSNNAEFIRSLQILIRQVNDIQALCRPHGPIERTAIKLVTTRTLNTASTCAPPRRSANITAKLPLAGMVEDCCFAVRDARSVFQSCMQNRGTSSGLPCTMDLLQRTAGSGLQTSFAQETLDELYGGGASICYKEWNRWTNTTMETEFYVS